MPRKKRFWETGCCCHVMLRGIDGRAVFCDERDRCKFLLLLQEAAQLHNFRIHAFCLMTNHIHLLLEPLEDGLGSGIHRFATRFAQHFNRRYKKRGYVFQGRFRSILVEDGTYMKRLLRYIHLNPIEALLVSRPQEYPWSSHNGYFFQTEYTWLESDRVLSYFGPNRTSALVNLAQFMAATMEAMEDRKEIERASRAGVYGCDEFKRSFVIPAVWKNPMDAEKFSFDALMLIVCEKLGVTKDQLSSSEKTRLVVDARAILARAAQLMKGLNLNDVCKALNKNHGTISRLAMKAARQPRLQPIINELVEAVS